MIFLIGHKVLEVLTILHPGILITMPSLFILYFLLVLRVVSFKLYLFILSLFFIACSTEATDTYTTGEEVYEARCSACHGKDFEGRVGPALDASSSSASMPDSYWVQTITKGKGSMPGSAENLISNMPEIIIAAML